MVYIVIEYSKIRIEIGVKRFFYKFAPSKYDVYEKIFFPTRFVGVYFCGC